MCVYVGIYVRIYMYVCVYLCITQYVCMYVCMQCVSTSMNFPALTENADSGRNFITQHVKWLPFLGLNLK